MTIFRRDSKRILKYTVILLILFGVLENLYIFNIQNSFIYKGKDFRSTNFSNANVSLPKKHILLWTNAYTTPFVYLGMGNKIFVNKKCKWTNCYVTNIRTKLGNYDKFDVIAFHGPELIERMTFGDIPLHRSPHQKYVYANIEAAANYPLCTSAWNDYFNWTWTYRLNSDAIWGYFVIRNASFHVIGPATNINWIKLEEMDVIEDEFKTKLNNKHKPAAWFVSNCETQSFREIYAKQLRVELNYLNMDLDIYGKCGQFSCPKENMATCLKRLEKSYYFYLAFENAISEDYVTERVIYALNHNTVPIVLGGANYSRFMPDGIYLNANIMKPKELAIKMSYLIKNPEAYQKFFRWHKYYSYHLRHESPDTDDYCNFCAIINNEKLMKSSTNYGRLDEWWTGPEKDKVCHPTSNAGNQVILEYG